MATSDIDGDALRYADTWYPLDKDESDYVAVDYVDMLDTGETLASVTNPAECTVLAGTDATPQSRLSGAPQISGTRVRQLVVQPLQDVDYLIRFKATTSTGRVLVIAGRLCAVREH